MMNKASKGAAAAATAGVLLLGGAGSLAYWTGQSDATGGSFDSGTLTIGAGTCGAWDYAAESAGEGTPVALFVPGDVVTNTCTFEIGATGDNMSATVSAPTDLTVTSPTPGALSFKATTVTAYAIDGEAFNPVTGKVTSADDGKDLTATFTVTIPYGTNETASTTINANDTQGITAALDALTVTLTQDNPNA
jgi:alternate signal-mediated exported protein